MNEYARPPLILMVDDDPDDYYLTKAALKKSGIRAELRLATNGEELLDYVFGRGRFAGHKAPPRPDLILLDLNMPGKNGLEALGELKADPATGHIPVVVYSSSRDGEDVAACYRNGANGYISKPAGFQSLINTMGVFAKYWLETVRLPSLPPCDSPPKMDLAS